MRLYAMWGNRKGKGGGIVCLWELEMHRVYSISVLRFTVNLYVHFTLHLREN